MRLQQSASEQLSRLPLWFTRNLDRVMALISVASLGIVFFDLSYVPWRDFYVKKLPTLLPAQLPVRDLFMQYDRFKGIEPNRDTQEYLATIAALKQSLQKTVSPQLADSLATLQQLNPSLTSPIDRPLRQQLTGWFRRHNFAVDPNQPLDRLLATFWQAAAQSKTNWVESFAFFDTTLRPLIQKTSTPQAKSYLAQVDQLKTQLTQIWLQAPGTEQTLEKLRTLSVEMIETNPFQAANKSGSLEKIKNTIVDHVPNPGRSSKQAFRTFWSRDYLIEKDWAVQIPFFERNISPLMTTNYFRRIGENSQFIDQFWHIDIWFVMLFAIDLLVRGLYRTITGQQQTYQGRWYQWLVLWPIALWMRDVLLWRWYDLPLLFPYWQWVRVVSVANRLHQTGLVEGEVLRARISQDIVSNFAGELTEIVVLRVLSQVQEAIDRGEISRWIFANRNQRAYVDLNNVNEVEEIARRLINITIYEVLPKIEPNLRMFIHYNINSAICRIPAYQQLHQLPGVGGLSTQLTEQLATELSQGLTTVLQASVQDEVGTKLFNQIVQEFGQALGNEIQRPANLQEIQTLVRDFIEELKVNYVQQSSTQEFQSVLKEFEQLHRRVSKAGQSK